MRWTKEKVMVKAKTMRCVYFLPQEEQEDRVQGQAAPISETGEPHAIPHFYFCLHTRHVHNTPLPSLQVCS